jgi:serine/threonine protein kinase
MTPPVTPRAVGSRADFDVVPTPLRTWLEETLGARVESAATQIGGMSPGPAARLLLDNGERVFVKAVGASLNAFTPRLFRREVEILRQLPSVDYRPAMLASYDDGKWVAIVLEDVDGRHPDLNDPADLAAARIVVRRQTAELTPNPVATDEPDLTATARRWSDEIQAASSESRSLLPAWWRDHEPELLERVASLEDQVPAECLCHLDIRDDNLLVRRDGSAVVFDWGMARPGPTWVDEVLLDLHVVHHASFDDRIQGLPSYADGTQTGEQRSAAVTDFVLTLAVSLALLAQGNSHGLPHLTEFRRRESERLLVGAERRLGLAGS